MWKKPAGYLVGIGAGVEGAVVGQHVAAQAGDPAVLGRGQLRGHVIVAGVGGRGQVLHPVLDPLHRPAEHDRADDGADIARIDADLVAEAAADVGCDHVHLGLGDAREQRDDRPDHVRRLEGAPDRDLALDLVEVADAGAGLERAGMDPLVGDQLLDRHLGLRERLVRGGLVARLPGEDVVGMPTLAVGARQSCP